MKKISMLLMALIMMGLAIPSFAIEWPADVQRYHQEKVRKEALAKAEHDARLQAVNARLQAVNEKIQQQLENLQSKAPKAAQDVLNNISVWFRAASDGQRDADAFVAAIQQLRKEISKLHKIDSALARSVENSVKNGRYRHTKSIVGIQVGMSRWYSWDEAKKLDVRVRNYHSAG